MHLKWKMNLMFTRKTIKISNSKFIMYTYSILWFLSWPALILASYFLVRWALKVIEKKNSQADGGKEV